MKQFCDKEIANSTIIHFSSNLVSVTNRLCNLLGPQSPQLYSKGMK